MRKIKWAFALIGLLVTFVSCDKGEEMEKGHTIVGDTLGLLILDKDGNNVMDPNIHKINPNVFYDTDMMVVFQGDTLTTEGWSNKPAYFNNAPMNGSYWFLRLSKREAKTGNRPYLDMLDIDAVWMYWNQRYEFDVVSPRNNYRWHLRVEYDTHTVAVWRDYIVRRCWVDGKRMPDVTTLGKDHMPYDAYNIILPMDK